MFSSIPLLQVDNWTVEQIQKNIIIPLNNLFNTNPFIDGVLIKDVALISANTTSVQHKLKRAYQGYFITKLNANSVIWIANSTDSEKLLNLNCTADCTVDLWVF